MITTAGKILPEIVDEIFGKLVKQGGVCETSGICMYGRENDHCALGWLLPPDNADLMVADGGVHDLLTDYRGELGPNETFILTNRSLMVCLQNFHDADGKHTLDESYGELPPFAKELPNTNAWYTLRTKQLESDQ